MTPDSESSKPLPSRQRPVHQPVIISGNRAVIVFLTVCTKDRAPHLATPAMHQAMLDAWRTADHWLIGRYVILPDHIHLFCAPTVTPPVPLASWIRFWKTAVSKSLKAPEGSLWQTDFWDTQLRQHESYNAKWDYVRQNPVCAGLVEHADEWPYQGEMNVLRWHD